MKNKQKIRVGIFGGSFNPCTKSHVEVAETVLSYDLVDQVWFMPCFSHNLGKISTDSFHRIEMIYRSIKHKDNMLVCLHEIQKKSDGKFYNTIRSLMESYKHINFYVIIGMDCAIEIDKWYKWEDLLKTVPFIVFQREGYNDEELKWDPSTVVFKKHKKDYSSTQAREAIANNDNDLQQKIMYKNVIKYIKQNGLYR